MLIKFFTFLVPHIPPRSSSFPALKCQCSHESGKTLLYMYFLPPPLTTHSAPLILFHLEANFAQRRRGHIVDKDHRLYFWQMNSYFQFSFLSVFKNKYDTLSYEFFSHNLCIGLAQPKLKTHQSHMEQDARMWW